MLASAKDMVKKKQKLKIIELIIAIVIVVIAIFLIVKLIQNINKNKTVEGEQYQEEQEEYVQLLDNGMKLNVSAKLKEPKEFEGLKFDNIQLVMQESQTLLTANVTNNTGADLDVTTFNVILLNDKEEEIVTIPGIIGSVKNGQTIELRTETTLDFANAYNFKIEINK